MSKSLPVCLGGFSLFGVSSAPHAVLLLARRQFPVIFYISFDFFLSFLKAKVTADEQLSTSFSEANTLDLYIKEAYRDRPQLTRDKTRKANFCERLSLPPFFLSKIRSANTYQRTNKVHPVTHRDPVAEYEHVLRRI